MKTKKTEPSRLLLDMGRRLALARAALGLTKADLLRALGSHGRSSPTRWEGGAGANFIPHDVIVELDRIWGVTPSYLYTGRMTDLPPELKTRIIEIERAQKANNKGC